MFILLLTIFIDLVGFGIILPILPFYAQAFDASAFEITLLVSTHSAAQIASSVFWGRLSDNYGRKTILLLTLAGGALAYVWFGLANSLTALFVARAFSGTMAGNIAVAQAYLADISKPEDRATAMGRLGAAFGLGFVVGPVLGSIFVGAEPTVFRNGIPGIIGLNFLVTISFTMLMALFPLWSQAQLGWGVTEVSYAYTYIGSLVAFFQGVLVGPLTKTLGEVRVLLIGAISSSIGLLTLTLADNVWVFAIDAVLLSTGTSLCHPTLAAMVSQRTPNVHQGTVMGTFNSVAAFSRIFSPPIGGAIFIHLGANWPLIFAGFIMLPVVGAAAWTSLRAKL